MANYTTEEIQAVVDGLVRSSVRRPYDTLGIRRTDVTFSDIQESAASVFLLYPRSPLYLASLAGQRALEVYEGIKAQLSDLNQSLAILRRRSLPVRDVSSLVNAKVALFELETIVTSKTPKDVTQIPAYVRFNSNVDRFLSAVGSNVKKDGKIVQTPEEARDNLPSLVTSLKAQVEDFLDRCRLLAEALSDYNSLGLPQLVSRTVVSNTRQLLAARADQLASMKESDRLLVLRDTVLEVLSAKAVVKGFGAFPGLTDAKGLSGTVTPFADTNRPGVGARIEVPLSGGLALVPGVDAASSTNILYAWLDGAASPTELYLPTSMYPKIDGQAAGPFTIDATNDTLSLVIDGTTVPITLTHGTAFTAAQVASDIASTIYPYGFDCVAYFSPVMYDGPAATSGNTVSPVSGTFLATSLAIGDEVDFYYGPNAGVTRTVAAPILTDGSGNITSFAVSGAPLVTSTENRIQYGSANRKIRIQPVDRVEAVVNHRKIQAKRTTSVNQAAWSTLGFYYELLGKGQPTTAASIMQYVQQSLPTVTASTRQNALWTGTLSSTPSDPFTVSGTFTGVSVDMAVVISEGPNAGTYYVDSVGTGTIKLRSGLPNYRDSSNQPLTFEASVGWENYVISSKTTSLTSALKLKSPSDSGNMYGPTSVVTGTTYYVKLPSSKSVSEGDLIEFYETSAAEPDLTATIRQVYADGVVLLDVPVNMTSSWGLADSALPFVRVLAGHVADFGALSTSLSSSLQSPNADTTAYFKDLNRLINPLLVNLNPTDSEVGAAENRLDQLSVLLEQMAMAMRSYQPEHVPQMDELIKTFKEKGADRAVDLLLSCQFSLFFGLSQEETSYAGAFQKAVRDVAMNDLPVHKTNRTASHRSQLISSATSTDYEDSTEDLDTSPAVDPPVTIDSTPA